MLEESELDQSVVSSAMMSSTETKFIDNIIKVREPVLYHNKKYAPLYGAVPDECDYVNKVMGEVPSLLTGNGL